MGVQRWRSKAHEHKEKQRHHVQEMRLAYCRGDLELYEKLKKRVSTHAVHKDNSSCVIKHVCASGCLSAAHLLPAPPGRGSQPSLSAASSPCLQSLHAVPIALWPSARPAFQSWTCLLYLGGMQAEDQGRLAGIADNEAREKIMMGMCAPPTTAAQLLIVVQLISPCPSYCWQQALQLQAHDSVTCSTLT